MTDRTLYRIRSAAVTGATGFIGSHLVDRLRRADVRVVALVRPGTDARGLRELGAEVVPGTIEDGKALSRAFERAEAVFHLAARVTGWGPRPFFRRVNVLGTERVLSIARAAGVRRFVLGSSDAVYGYHRPHRGTAESAPYASRVTDPYTWSKIEAERRAMEARGEEGPTVTIARMGLAWGPRDRTILPRLLEFLRSPLFFYAGSGENVLDLAYVENVVDGLYLLAVHPDAAGNSYNLHDGQRLTLRVFLERLCQALGEPVPPRRFVPRPVARAGAALGEFLWRAGHFVSEPPLTRWTLDSLFQELDFSTERVRQLGFSPRVSFEEGLARTAGWFRSREATGTGNSP